MENRYCYAVLSAREHIFIMNTCICFISRFTCFTLLPVHFLREPQYCFYANRFGGGYIVSFAPPPMLPVPSNPPRIYLREDIQCFLCARRPLGSCSPSK